MDGGTVFVIAWGSFVIGVLITIWVASYFYGKDEDDNGRKGKLERRSGADRRLKNVRQ